MSRRIIKWVIPTVVIVILAAMFLLTMACAMPAEQVMSIDGSPVLEEEFFLLLRENTVQYESQLRREYSIPGEQSVRSYFEQDEGKYWRRLFEQNVTYLTYVRIEQALAAKYDAAPKFTYEAFLAELAMENRRREESISKGEPIYGLRSFTPEQYYSYKMSNLRTEVLRVIPDEELGVAKAAAEQYYRELPYFAHLDGERIHYTLYDVTAAGELSSAEQSELYSGISAALTQGTDADVTAGTMTCRAEKCAFTSRELRDFLRQSFDGEALLSLDVGEVIGPFSLGGKSYFARYNGFDKAETLTEGELDVFMLQMREQAYRELLTQEAARADVQVNENSINRYTREGSVS